MASKARERSGAGRRPSPLDASPTPLLQRAVPRARRREAEDRARTLDAYEKDSGLQARTGAVYRELAAAEWNSPWWTIAPDVDPGILADKLALLQQRHDTR